MFGFIERWIENHPYPCKERYHNLQMSCTHTLYFRILFTSSSNSLVITTCYVFLSCAYDYLELLDGSTSNDVVISHLCGNTRPSTQHSSGSSMLLRFRTDISVTHKGFKAKYSIGRQISKNIFQTQCLIKL